MRPFTQGGKEGPAETVYLGVFRSVLERLGGYDGHFAREQVVCGLGVALVIAPWWSWSLRVPARYLLTVSGGEIVVGTGLDVRGRVLVPVALGVMHLSWGVGFLTSPKHLKRHAEAVATSSEAAR